MSSPEGTQPTAPTGETAGDYSYDMAHEAPPATTLHEDAADKSPGAPADLPPDAGGDYSYDLAHEVPRRDEQ